MPSRTLTCPAEPVYIGRSSIQLMASISIITLSMLIINTFLNLDIARCSPERHSCTTSIAERIPLMVAATAGVLSFFAWILGCLHEFSNDFPAIVGVVFDLMALVGFLVAGVTKIPNRIDYDDAGRCEVLKRYGDGTDACGMWTVDIVLCFMASVLQMVLVTWILLGMRHRPRPRPAPVQQGIPLQTLTTSGRAVRGTAGR